ncbi:MAG: ClpP family protease [Candidatus Helarchaeota archaeon]
MTKKKKITSTSVELDYLNTLHDKNIYVPSRTIYFGGTSETMDEVDSLSVAQTIKNFYFLEKKKIAPITLFLNSCGGSWYDGIALYDVIKNLKSKVTIIGIGQLFSMGSVIFQAGDKRVLTEHTRLMIHDGSDGYEGIAKSYENWAEESKNIRNNLYSIYYERMKKKNKKITLKKIENMCSNDCILNAKETIELGLADKIIKDIV